MAIKDRDILKEYFKTGSRPIEQEFADFIESNLHRTEDKATTDEVQVGVNDNKFITPAGVKSAISQFVPSVGSATEISAGIVQIATTTEAQAGTNTTKAVTPAGVKSAITQFVPNSSTTARGTIQTATTTEAQTGTDTAKAVTPAGAKAAVLKFAPSTTSATETITGIVRIATLSEVLQEKGTNTVVTPYTVRYAVEQFAPVRTVNGILPVSGNIELSLQGNDMEWISIGDKEFLYDEVGNYDEKNPVRYKRKNGIVFLEGRMKGGGPKEGIPLFTLQKRFGPSRRTSFMVMKSDKGEESNILAGRIDIDTEGIVYGISYGAAWTDFSGISFPIEDSTEWVFVKDFIQKEIVNLDEENIVRYRKKGGIVFLDGKFKGGKPQEGEGNPLFALEKEFIPSRKQSFMVLVSDGKSASVGRIDIDEKGLVYGIVYNDGWVSLSDISFPLD